MDDSLQSALDVHCGTLEADVARAAESRSQVQIQEVASAIDETMDILTRLKNKLGHSRNLMSAVNRIPLEILTRIFLYAVPRASNCANVASPELMPVSGKLGVVAISHVCRHWRAITLSTPSLWIRYTPQTTTLLHMFLSRSADIPMVLDVCYAHNHSPTNEYLQLLFDQLPRARGLYMDLHQVFHSNGYLSRWEAWKSLRIIRKIPPSLEHLHISARGIIKDIDSFRDATQWGQDDIQWMPHDWADTKSLLGLRHVFLHSVPIQWDCVFLRHLRTLTLINSHIDPISLSCLSDIAAACPEIEELTINSIPWKYRHYDLEDQSIDFPRLRLARISVNDYRCVQQLLLRIVLPSTARVWIDVSEQIQQHIITTLIHASAFFFRQRQEPLEQLGITLTRYDAGVYGSIKDSTGALVLTMKNVHDFITPPTLSTFDPLLNQDLSQLIKFECNLDGMMIPCQCYSSEWWCQMFTRAPNIRTLAFRNEKIASVAIHALMSAEEDDDTSSTMPLLLPNLAYIATSWVLSSNLPQQIQDERGIVYQVRRLLSARNNHVGHVKKLTAGLFSSSHKPKNFKELFDANFQFVGDPNLTRNFLLDPRYRWGCDLDLDEVQDSLLY